MIKLEPGEELDEVLNEVIFLQSCVHRNIVSYGGCFMKKGQVKGEKQFWVCSSHVHMAMINCLDCDGILRGW